jgi:hypothetical protein
VLVEPLSAADGRSARMLAWAREPSQYAAIARDAGRLAWEIVPAYEAYDRTTLDHVATLTADPVVCLWDLEEMDDDARRGLRARAKLASLGYTGPSATASFQAVAGGLTVDNKCGPRTLAALGIA